MDYTKGEWLTYADYGGAVEFIVVKCGKYDLQKIAIISQGYKESDANAHLISAAPIMYEVCNVLMANDENLRVQKAKEELFCLVPELKPILKRILSKVEGNPQTQG